MATERSFNVLELCVFPKGCQIPEEDQLPMATLFVPRLEAAGMTTAEWTRGAQMLEEPHLTKVQNIVCRRCDYYRCPFNPGMKPAPAPDSLLGLKDGLYSERINRGNKILSQLLPEERQAHLKQSGVTCIAFQMPSRKNPKLVFSFKQGEKTRRLTCEVGTRRLRIDGGEERLVSLQQLQDRVNQALDSLVV